MLYQYYLRKRVASVYLSRHPLTQVVLTVNLSYNRFLRITKNSEQRKIIQMAQGKGRLIIGIQIVPRKL